MFSVTQDINIIKVTEITNLVRKKKLRVLLFIALLVTNQVSSIKCYSSWYHCRDFCIECILHLYLIKDTYQLY